MVIDLEDVATVHRALSITGAIVGTQKLDTINQLSEREAMGLTNQYIGSNLDDICEQTQKLDQLTTEQLLAMVENADEKFLNRFVCGQILSSRGDPRINVLEPTMLKVPGATVTLGLKPQAVAEVVNQYQHYGVLSEWIEKETPEYQLDIPAFNLAKYCVTNQEYKIFLEDTGHKEFPTSWEYGMFKAELANHPVATIDAKDADLYVQWLSEKTGLKYRLPTEAEWEYAASGGQGLEFPWGNSFAADRANTVESGIFRSTPVGIFPKGAGLFGHLDLAGNVEEYVSDDYHAYPGADLIVDDLLENNGQYRVARGGSFTRFRDLARTRRRHGRYHSNLYVMGFRLAQTID